MRLKRIVGIGVLLITALMVMVYVLLATYDYNKLKPWVARMVKDATGRELRLEGEINLAIGFSPSLVVKNVIFANASWGSQPQMIKIERLQAQVRLLPLLRKDVELTHIGVKGVDVLLESNSKGEGNWDFTGGDKSEKSLGALGPVKIDINSMRIENFRLAIRKGKTGSAKRFTLTRLDVARQSAGDAQTIDLISEYNGQPIVLTGTTGLFRHIFTHPRFPLQLSGKFSNTDVKIHGMIDNVLNFHSLDLEVRVSGTNLAALKSGKDIQLPKTSAFEVTGDLLGSMESLMLKDINGSLAASGVEISINGNIGDLITLTGIDLNLKVSAGSLAELGPLVGTNLPRIGPFDANGQLTGSAKSLSLNKFSTIIDKSDFKGLAKIEFREQPKIIMELESSVVDFTPLMKSREKNKPKSVETNNGKGRLFSDAPLPFDALQKVSADVRIKVENIHAKDARLKSGHLSLKIQDGNFSIDKLEAIYKETKISGNFQLNPGSPSQLSTHFTIQNFDLGSFLKETGVSDQVSANLDIATQLKSRGDSVHSLMANLEGSIGAVMGEGYLTKYLDIISMDLSKKVLGFWRFHEKADQINCAVVQFDIKDGIAASRAFVFDTQIGILKGEGEINLGTGRVDFLLVPTPKKPGLLKFYTKLRVSGSILDAKVTPDPLALLTKGARMLSTLEIGPIGLLLPFVHLGVHKKHPCDIQSIGQIGQNIPAKKR